VVADALVNIVLGSLISTGGGIGVSAVMVPGDRQTGGALDIPQPASSSMDAVTRGTVDGVSLLLNIVAMLVVLVALVSLANQVVGLLPDVAGAPLSLQRVLGWLMAPLVWIMGIPWSEATTAGALMGTKTVLNELIAYIDLAKLPEGALEPRSRLVMTYALCGFANFGSLGIMIGGLATMAPERRAEIVSLGTRTIVSGTLATCIAGAVVGVLY
jgi:CNT family concentrative nucleoside transporter